MVREGGRLTASSWHCLPQQGFRANVEAQPRPIVPSAEAAASSDVVGLAAEPQLRFEGEDFETRHRGYRAAYRSAPTHNNAFGDFNAPDNHHNPSRGDDLSTHHNHAEPVSDLAHTRVLAVDQEENHDDHNDDYNYNYHDHHYYYHLLDDAMVGHCDVYLDSRTPLDDAMVGYLPLHHNSLLVDLGIYHHADHYNYHNYYHHNDNHHHEDDHVDDHDHPRVHVYSMPGAEEEAPAATAAAAGSP